MPNAHNQVWDKCVVYSDIEPGRICGFHQSSEVAVGEVISMKFSRGSKHSIGCVIVRLRAHSTGSLFGS